MTTRRVAMRKFAFSLRPYTFSVRGDPLYNGRVCGNVKCSNHGEREAACMKDEASACRVKGRFTCGPKTSVTFDAHELYGYALGLALLEHDGSREDEERAAAKKRGEENVPNEWSKTRLCGGVLMPNHEHLITSMGFGHCGPFKKALHGEVAKALPGLMRRGRIEAFPNIWDARNPHDMILVNAEAALSRHLYCVMNPMLAGMVRRIDRYPGFLIRAKHWGTTLRFRRPPIYFSQKKPDVVEVKVAPPPALLYMWRGDVARLKADVTRLERELEESVRVRIGSPIGVKKLRQQHPWDEPKTQREYHELKEETLARYVYTGWPPPKGEENGHPTTRAHDECVSNLRLKRGSYGKARHGEREAERCATTTESGRRRRDAMRYPFSTHKKRVEDGVLADDGACCGRLIRTYVDPNGEYVPFVDDRATEDAQRDALAMTKAWMVGRIEKAWPEGASAQPESAPSVVVVKRRRDDVPDGELTRVVTTRDDWTPRTDDDDNAASEPDAHARPRRPDD